MRSDQPEDSQPGGGARRPRGPDRVSWALLALWVGLLSADRIDLVGGTAPFALTPFLTLTPVLIGFEVFRLVEERGRLRLPRSGRVYLLLFFALVAVVALSGLVGLDPVISAQRTALLVVIVLTTLFVAVSVTSREGSLGALVAGAKLGLLLAAAFDVLQVVAPLQGIPSPFPLGIATVNLDPHGFFGVVPRLTGQVADANRGGFLIVFYLFVLFRWAPPGPATRRWLLFGTALFVPTVSRSAILTAATTAAVIFLEAKPLRLSPRRALAALGLGAGILVGTMSLWATASPDSRAAIVRTLDPFSERVALGQGSAAEHVYLLGRGVGVATESIRNASIGIGYGTSPLILQDLFPGTDFGNFHSIYVSALVDSGVVALALVVWLLAAPALLPGPVRPFIVGAALFNVFYQSIFDPPFWFALAMAWLTVRTAHAWWPERSDLARGGAA